MRRAQSVADELERIMTMVGKNLQEHRLNVDRFRARMKHLSGEEDVAAIQDLCSEVEGFIEPTMQLANQMAAAYDEIRQQGANLLTITEVRTDPLTGVMNRRGLDDTLNSHKALASRYGSTFSVAVLDIDHFKRINDQHGHLQGDVVLQQLADTVSEGLRETDVFGRFGGEEFLVLMPHTDLSGACIFAERIRRRVEEQTAVTVSIGVAMMEPGEGVGQLIERGDMALYAAKSAGRNCSFYHDGIDMHMAESLLSALDVPNDPGYVSLSATSPGNEANADDESSVATAVGSDDRDED